MGHCLHKLSAEFAKNAPAGKHSDGGRLWLHAREGGGAQWFLRVTIHGRRREVGLGSLRDVSLREARESASHWRALAKQGVDPSKEREKERRHSERDLHVLSDGGQGSSSLPLHATGQGPRRYIDYPEFMETYVLISSWSGFLSQSVHSYCCACSCGRSRRNGFLRNSSCPFTQFSS